MDERTDLRAALRELAGESGGSGPHCGTRRLIAYREGTLPAAERDKVEEHLSLCPRCTRLLRELRDFEAAAGGETGPESLRQEAWDALARRLPAKTPTIRPLPSAVPDERRRFPRLIPLALAAVLLLAVTGLTLWAAVTVFQEHRELALLQRRLAERDAAVTALQRSLAEAERQLGAARRQIQDLERAKALVPAPEKREPVVVASREIEVSVAPRYVLRGQEAPGGPFLREGAVSSVRAKTRDHRVAVALDLAGHPAYDEYRFELIGRDGKALWSGRRPGDSVLGDAGTSVSIRGLDPGSYRLRVAGVKPAGSEPVAEYLLSVE